MGGIKVKEMNKLERQFIDTLDWELHVSPNKFTTYHYELEVHPHHCEQCSKDRKENQMHQTKRTKANAPPVPRQAAQGAAPSATSTSNSSSSSTAVTASSPSNGHQHLSSPALPAPPRKSQSSIRHRPDTPAIGGRRHSLSFSSTSSSSFYSSCSSTPSQTQPAHAPSAATAAETSHMKTAIQASRALFKDLDLGEKQQGTVDQPMSTSKVADDYVDNKDQKLNAKETKSQDVTRGVANMCGVSYHFPEKGDAYVYDVEQEKDCMDVVYVGELVGMTLECDNDDADADDDNDDVYFHYGDDDDDFEGNHELPRDKRRQWVKEIQTIYYSHHREPRQQEVHHKNYQLPHSQHHMTAV